jgi:phosphoribosylformylglycinamidine (FGAM) synthase-like amidotransferase family enzyme
VRIAVWDQSAPLEADVVVVPPGATPSGGASAALRAFVGRGGRVLALGDGVSVLCAAELLPGSVTTAPPAATHVRVEGRATPFTWAIPAGRILPLGLVPAHRWSASDDDATALASGGRVLLRYCDASGGLTASSAAAAVAGLCDDTGRVVGILGGISHALDCALGNQIRSCLESSR